MAVGEKTRYGNILAEWRIPEFIKHERSTAWYYIVGLGMAGLFVHAIASLNFLFAIILFLSASIIYLHERQEPEMLDFLIVETGIVLGKRYMPFKDLQSFWIIYDPVEKHKILYFGVNGTLRRELPVDLDNQDPVAIRNILLQFLSEDLDKEDLANDETISRVFRI